LVDGVGIVCSVAWIVIVLELWLEIRIVLKS
jgi:hypothetical protein